MIHPSLLGDAARSAGGRLGRDLLRRALLAGALACMSLGAVRDAEAGWFGRRRSAESAESKQLATDALRILRSECFGCHSEKEDKGGLDLTSAESLLAGGDDGKVVVPRRPEKSSLIGVLAAGADPHMPPKKQLSAERVEVLRRWVAAGLPWDKDALARAAAPRGVVLEPLPETYRPVQGVAFDPEAKRVAWATGDELVVHDVAATNTPVLFRTRAHADVVRAVAWSADGRWLATGGFRELTVRSAVD
ncbi:MAG: hypothetical protein JNL97_06885, partial [Verrucomicrobiales bacterium]|nr:hypothetical protein [Verrucomicrobiales bacterium]